MTFHIQACIIFVFNQMNNDILSSPDLGGQRGPGILSPDTPDTVHYEFMTIKILLLSIKLFLMIAIKNKIISLLFISHKPIVFLLFLYENDTELVQSSVCHILRTYISGVAKIFFWWRRADKVFRQSFFNN